MSEQNMEHCSGRSFIINIFGNSYKIEMVTVFGTLENNPISTAKQHRNAQGKKITYRWAREQRP